MSAKVKELIGELSITDYVNKKIQEFQDEVASWKITEGVKELIPSRCKVGDDDRSVALTYHSVSLVLRASRVIILHLLSLVH